MPLDERKYFFKSETYFFLECGDKYAVGGRGTAFHG